MVNTKGIIRIIEASAAILIIFIVILTFSMTRKASTAETDLSGKITPLLEEIAKNNSMREIIVATDINDETSKNVTIGMILDFVNLRIDSNIGRDANVCDVGAVCGMRGGYPRDISGNIYAGSRIISSSLSNAALKRISIFLWFKK
jgi:hypothetical protein